MKNTDNELSQRQLKVLALHLGQTGWTREDFSRIEGNPNLLGQFQEVVRGKATIVENPLTQKSASSSGDLIVQESEEIELIFKMPLDSDRFISLNKFEECSDMTHYLSHERFFADTVSQQKRFLAKLFSFPRGRTYYEEITRHIEGCENNKTGWKLAFLEHLLVYGSMTLSSAGNDPIIALGCVYVDENDHYKIPKSPVIQMERQKRCLRTHPQNGAFSNFFNFLAVKEVV
jgi:hypothetical protein